MMPKLYSLGDLILQTITILICLLAVGRKWGWPLWVKYGPKPAKQALKPEIVAQIPVLQAEIVSSPITPVVADPPEDDDYDDEDDEDDYDEEEEEVMVVDPPEREQLQHTPVLRPVYLRPTQVAGFTTQSPWDQWMARVFRDAIHLIVIGQTGAGKTTVLQVFVESLVGSGVPVVVCDPDAAQGDWPGTELHGAGDDFNGINRALQAIQQVARERRQARAEGERSFDPLWVVLDEYADIKSECALATNVVENLLRRARKLNIHLVIGVQDTQVKTMGFERRSELLNNARIVTLSIDAQHRRFAAIDGEARLLIPQLTPNRGPAIILPAESSNPVQDFESDPEPEEPIEGGDKDDKIRQLLALGQSYAEIARQLRVATTRISKVKKDFMLES